jgi:hypothetical protein
MSFWIWSVMSGDLCASIITLTLVYCLLVFLYSHHLLRWQTCCSVCHIAFSASMSLVQFISVLPVVGLLLRQLHITMWLLNYYNSTFRFLGSWKHERLNHTLTLYTCDMLLCCLNISVWQRQENRRENKNAIVFVMHVFKLEGAYFRSDLTFMLKVLKPVW